LIWYYDTLDIAPYLRSGNNEIRFEVLRYFAASRSAMPFERTTHAGLTVVGSVELEAGAAVVELTSGVDWQAQVDDSISFPTGLVDDGFLHVNFPNAIYMVSLRLLLTSIISGADQRTHYSYYPKPMGHACVVWYEDVEWRPSSLAPSSTCYPYGRRKSSCRQHRQSLPKHCLYQ
jgi:hypothetical protein